MNLIFSGKAAAAANPIIEQTAKRGISVEFLFSAGAIVGVGRDALSKQLEV